LINFLYLSAKSKTMKLKILHFCLFLNFFQLSYSSVITNKDTVTINKNAKGVIINNIFQNDSIHGSPVVLPLSSPTTNAKITFSYWPWFLKIDSSTGALRLDSGMVVPGIYRFSFTLCDTNYFGTQCSEDTIEIKVLGSYSCDSLRNELVKNIDGIFYSDVLASLNVTGGSGFYYISGNYSSMHSG
jgi:hypothetical protein